MCATAVTTFPQPFLAHQSKSGYGVTLQTDWVCSWEAHQWTVPIGLSAGQVLKLGGQLLSLQFVPRVYVDSPSGGPYGAGLGEYGGYRTPGSATVLW